jgi:uncharacterized RDD family membrane protein YckC
LELLLERGYDRLYERLEREEQAQSVRWGGFFRRSSAFVVDLLALSLFSIALLYLAYVAYSVGLAAHRQWLSWTQAHGFWRMFLPAWLLLFFGYFVVLHGAAGATVGKWLFGLRVVGAGRRPVGYPQATVRSFCALLFAPLLLGFLWILWSREKRGWHDLIAGTWVIRE